MITKLNVASIYVLDKEEALDFYVNKLGLEKGSDVKQGDYRWLTVKVPATADIEISLEQPGPPLHDEATGAQLRELITKGAHGRPRVHHRRCSRPLRDAQGARRDRLHPGAHRALLRHGYGPPRPVRKPDPDPPAGQGPRKRRRPDRHIRLPKGDHECLRPRRTPRASEDLDGRREGRDARRASASARRSRSAAPRKSERRAKPALLAKIAEMPPAEREMAERLHAIVHENAPELMPKT